MSGTLSDQTLEEAMSLLLDLAEAPDDPALAGRLRQWLEADPAHPPAWDRARQTWATLGETVPELADQWATVPADSSPARQGTATITPLLRRPGTTAPRRHAGRLRAGLAGLAAAACLALLLAPSLSVKLRADHATATAELRDIELEDGSRVRLGARSAIATDFSAGSRQVTLLAGEAWFDVHHDAGRPFIVHAEAADTRVLGTAFEVQMDDQATSIAVARRLVGVTATLPPAGRPEERLHPGERISIDHATGAMERGQLPVGQVASWRDGHLFANNATVAQVVSRLSRYESGWIIIADEALARRRVTGLYDPTQPERALRALVQPGGGRVRQVTPFLYVLSES